MTASSQHETVGKPQGWAINTSCDIRLGEVFRTNPDLHRKYLEINTDSIRKILDHLAPNSSGVLHFEAVHGDTLGNNDDDYRYGREATTVFGHAIETDDGSFECLVGVAGGTHYGARFGKPEEIKNVDELDTENIIQAVRSLGKTVPTSTIQSFAIHELTHVADLNNTNLVKKQKREKVSELYQQRAALLASVAIPAFLAQEYAEKLPVIPDSMITRAVAGLGGAIVGFIAYVDHFARRIELKNYKNNNLEKRANDSSEANLKLFPRIIKFKDIK